jgi:DNA-binding response OmpR family regulator
MTDEGLVRIVFIEDDTKTIDLVKLILRREGFDVIGVTNGRDGLATIEQARPQLVLLDLMMPDMDGWEVYQADARSREHEAHPSDRADGEGAEH